MAKLVCHSNSVEFPRKRWWVPKTMGSSAVTCFFFFFSIKSYHNYLTMEVKISFSPGITYSYAYRPANIEG